MVDEVIVGRGTKTSKQADAERPGIVALHRSTDHRLSTARGDGTVPVDYPAIADVAPASLLDMPAPDLSRFAAMGQPFIQSGGVALQ